MPDPITWTNETRKLSDLIPWERNPRQIKKPQAARLVESFHDFGQVEPVAIGPGNDLYNGHQRLATLQAQYGPDYEVDVRVASRSLSEAERQKLTIFLHQGTTGEFDFNELANWNAADLVDWGMDADALKTKKSEAAALATLLNFVDDSPDGFYTRKIKAPIYTPSPDPAPSVADLYDTSATLKLSRAILDAHLPEDVTTFLLAAATRHTVFNFQKIADYYAAADPALQRLMEESALVIIDFDRAIELGFVNLSQEIAQQYAQDYDNAPST